MFINEKLLASIRNNEQSITEITIDGGYKEKATPEDIVQLSKALEKNTFIQSITIASLKLTDQQIEPLLACIISHPSIKRVNLGDNQLGDISAMTLAKTATLTHISLYNNQLTNEGALILSQNNVLLEVNLKKNKISSRIAKNLLLKTIENRLKIAWPLKQITFDLQSLELDDADVEKLVNLIKKYVNAPIVALCLRGNHITDKGAALLAQCHLIRKLSIANNPQLTAEGVKILMANKSFEKLNFFVDYYGAYNDEKEEDLRLDIIKMLEENNPNNKVLNLGTINATDPINLDGQMLLGALSRNEYITCIRMNKQSNNLLALLEAVLERKAFLEELSFKGCHYATYDIAKPCDMKNSPIITLGKLIDKNKHHIKIIDLSGMLLERSPDLDSLFLALSQCKNLTSLNVANNSEFSSEDKKIDDKIIFKLSRHLRNFGENIESLDFSGNEISAQMMPLLCSGLSRCINLKHINFSSCGIDTNGMQILAVVLARFTKLESVNFSENPLYFSMVMNSLQASASSLKELFFYNTYYDTDNDNSVEFKKFFSKTIALQVFEMPYTPIYKEIFQALSSLKFLTSLRANLSWHSDDAGIIALAKFLSANTSLKKLTLWDSVHQQGGKALEDAFKVNFTLQELDYFRTPSCEADLQQYVQRNKKKASSSWQPHPFSIISPTALQKGERIGIGTYGTVYRGSWNGTPVAIKEFRLQTEDEKIKKDFENEVKLLSNLNHDHIISFRGVVVETPRSIVMAFAACGTLYLLLHDKKIELNWSERLRLALEIALGLAYLHQRQPTVIHCDLKSANVLLDGARQAKLSDFGLAKTKTTSSSQTQGGARGTPTHMAPELFDEEQGISSSKLTPKIDIYSLGIILWELATREVPFADKNFFQIMKLVTEGKRPTESTLCNDVYKNLVINCWAQKPGNRLDASQVVNNLQCQQQTYQISLPTIPLTEGGFMSMGSI